MFGFRPHTDKFDLESVRGFGETICSKAFDVKLVIGWIAHETKSFSHRNSELIQVSCYCLARWGGMVFCEVE